MAEIYSSDLPPFHKIFLRMDTTDDQLQITLHQAVGDLPATTTAVGTVPFDRAPTPETSPASKDSGEDVGAAGTDPA